MPFDPNKVKSGIVDILREQYPGKDLHVTVGPNGYGCFIWDDRGSAHVHISSRELRSSLGARGYAKLRKRLVKVSLTWNQLREAAGR